MDHIQEIINGRSFQSASGLLSGISVIWISIKKAIWWGILAEWMQRLGNIVIQMGIQPNNRNNDAFDLPFLWRDPEIPIGMWNISICRSQR
jgi:hypothetical protein